VLAWRNDPSASGGSFVVLSSYATPSQACLLFHGPDRDRFPFLGGTLWVHAPITRSSAQLANAAGSTSYPISVTAPMVGTRRCYQLWFRDPLHPDGTGSGLTNGLEVVFWP